MPTLTQIKVLSELVKNKCEMCHQETHLIPHRIRRGYQNGEYIPRNIMMVCEECHKKIHYNEPGCNKK
jgi:hypothetical protein